MYYCTDVVQKIIAGDSRKDLALQAKAYVILARTSTIGRKPLDAYKTAIELAAGTADRIDYILEAALWMSAYGLSRPDISEMLMSALAELYEKDEVTSHAATDALYDKRGSVDLHAHRSPMAATLSQIEGSGSMTASRSFAASSTVERKFSTQQTPRAGASESRSKRGDSYKDGDRYHSNSNSSSSSSSSSTVDMDSKDCEQAVRTCLMLALLQCNERSRLDR